MNKIFYSILGLFLLPSMLLAQDNPGLKALFAAGLVYEDTNQENWGDVDHLSSDNGDGTFTNPMLHADFPDPDIIRVGDDYYMISSTLQCTPGIPICHSTDLVNWRIIGHAIDSLNFRPQYSMQRDPDWTPTDRLEPQFAYGRGAWVSSFKYYDGIYYIAVNLKDDGFAMLKSRNPEGPYQMYLFGKSIYDPGIFIDDDGSKYIFSGNGKITLTKLLNDGTNIDRTAKAKVVIEAPAGFERQFQGSRAYKRDGWYYVFNHGNGIQFVSRSRDIWGPYETQVFLDSEGNRAGAGVHRGGIVETQTGETWAFMLHDRDHLGRNVMLFPISWKKGWPMSYNKGIMTYRKPNVGHSHQNDAFTFPLQSDHFDKTDLKAFWEWNHTPQNNYWSLTDRPHHLRIYSQPCISEKFVPNTNIVQADPKAPYELHSLGFYGARNSLTQRLIGPASTTIVKLDVSHLKVGDFAGSGIMGSRDISFGAYRREKGDFEIQLRWGNRNGESVEWFDDDESGLEVKQYVWLRIQLQNNGSLNFSYSTNGKNYRQLGGSQQSFALNYLGLRTTLFCYNDQDAGPGDCGYADFDSFEIISNRRGNNYNGHAGVDFIQYDERHGFDLIRVTENKPEHYFTNLKEGDYIKFNNIINDRLVSTLSIQFYADTDGGQIEVRLDGPKGKLLGVMNIEQCCVYDGTYESCFSRPGEWQDETLIIPALEPGTHSFYFRVKGSNPTARIKGFRFY